MQSTEVSSEIEALWIEIEVLRAKNIELQKQINRLRDSIPSLKPTAPEIPWGPVLWCSSPDEQTMIHFNGKL